jgi:uncharacterized protein (TIGR02646 family)
MILIDRGLPDRDGAENLAALELRALAAMRAVVATQGRDPNREEIEAFDYRIAGTLLCRRQGLKCAYCEHPEQRKRNDVEHFRPKGRALRGAHVSQTHGYWWLAWRWENLLFSCANCNQSPFKLDRFPLAAGSGVLVAEDDPYGAQAGVEHIELIDPSRESGVDHIEFERVTLPGSVRQWRPVARNGSVRGATTIRVCGLDRDDLLDAYEAHVREVVQREVDRFRGLGPLSAPSDRQACWREVESWLYQRGRPFVGLSYDALRLLVPDAELAASGIVRTAPR